VRAPGGLRVAAKVGSERVAFRRPRARLEKDEISSSSTSRSADAFQDPRRGLAGRTGRGGRAEGALPRVRRAVFRLHTLQDHQVGNTRSDLLFKARCRTPRAPSTPASSGSRRAAARSDAIPSQPQLVLSDHAKATSIPMPRSTTTMSAARTRHRRSVDPQHMFLPALSWDSGANRQADARAGILWRRAGSDPFEHARQPHRG